MKQKAQTALEYLLIIVVAIAVVTAVFVFVQTGSEEAKNISSQNVDCSKCQIDQAYRSDNVVLCNTTCHINPNLRECSPGETFECDTGLFGICAEGERRCTPSLFIGPCKPINFPVAEKCTDGLDNDCDNKTDLNDYIDCLPLIDIFRDYDRDGYCNMTNVKIDYVAEEGWLVAEDCAGDWDCDDNETRVNPGLDENCTDGLDNDCDGRIDLNDYEGCLPLITIYRDSDGDNYCDMSNYITGYVAEPGWLAQSACAGWDCNDNNPSIHPGASEVCGDGIDNDCSGGDAGCGGGGGGGGGCPFIYAYNGSDYEFAAVVFPFALIPAAEAYSYSALPYLKAKDGLLDVAIAQQLPEISSINAIRLFALDHPKGTEIVPGTDGANYLISDTKTPVTCVSRFGTDCKKDVSLSDGVAYLHDFAGKAIGDSPDIHEHIQMEFDVPKDATGATIILKAKESGLLSFMWWAIHNELGTADISPFVFLQSANSLADFFGRDAQLKVEYYSGGKWLLAGKDLPGYVGSGDGGKVAFPVELDGQKTLKVRLSFPIGGFEVDYTGVSFLAQTPVKATELALVGANDNSGNNAKLAISSVDDNYITLNQGDWLKALFADIPKEDAYERTYVIWPEGHYLISIEEPFFGEDFDVYRILNDERYLYDYAFKTYGPNIAYYKEIYSPANVVLAS